METFDQIQEFARNFPSPIMEWCKLVNRTSLNSFKSGGFVNDLIGVGYEIMEVITMYCMRSNLLRASSSHVDKFVVHLIRFIRHSLVNPICPMHESVYRILNLIRSKLVSARESLQDKEPEPDIIAATLIEIFESSFEAQAFNNIMEDLDWAISVDPEDTRVVTYEKKSVIFKYVRTIVITRAYQSSVDYRPKQS